MTTMRYSAALLALLAGSAALGSMAIHLLVPAFPVIGRDLQASSAEMQSALTVYLIALGLGQLIAGALSDLVGRRCVILIGAGLFALGSGIAAVSGAIELLVLGRVLQALGAAGALVAARTIISDVSDPQVVTGRLATLAAVVLISPAISPVVGGLMASVLGWRSIFLMLAGFGSMVLWIGFRRLKETRQGEGILLTSLIPAYRRLLRNRHFARYCLTTAAASSSLYIFLSASPFLLSQRYGLNPTQAGFCYLSIATGAVIGTLSVGFLERSGRALQAGVTLVLLGGSLMLLVALVEVQALAALFVPMLLIACGGGIAIPATMSGVMHAEAGLAGAGSSLAGALQMIVTGLVTTLAAQLQSQSPLTMPIGIFVASAIAFVAAPSRARASRQ